MEQTSHPTFQLEYTDAKGNTKVYPLKDGENTIGRLDTCDVFVEEKSVSRVHAVITIAEGRVTIRDLESKNHTFVAGARIRSEVELKPGNALMFGLLRLRFSAK